MFKILNRKAVWERTFPMSDLEKVVIDLHGAHNNGAVTESITASAMEDCQKVRDGALVVIGDFTIERVPAPGCIQTSGIATLIAQHLGLPYAQVERAVVDTLKEVNAAASKGDMIVTPNGDRWMKV